MRGNTCEVGRVRPRLSNACGAALRHQPHSADSAPGRLCQDVGASDGPLPDVTGTLLPLCWSGLWRLRRLDEGGVRASGCAVRGSRPADRAEACRCPLWRALQSVPFAQRLLCWSKKLYPTHPAQQRWFRFNWDQSCCPFRRRSPPSDRHFHACRSRSRRLRRHRQQR
jgi:hypothetical protein